MSKVDEHAAIRALAYRLNDWGVDDASTKAREFIEALVARGWQLNPNREQRPVPPKPGEQCHACQRAMHAPDAACATPTIRPVAPAPDPAAKVARLRAVVDETRAELCAHGTPRRNCLEHRTATTEETR